MSVIGWTGLRWMSGRSLLYLQYLTYGSLRVEALHRLKDLVMSPDKIDQIYHSETVLDLFGHCCELVGDIQVALDAYNTLLRGMPRNNAANWHKQRLEQIMKNYN